MSVNDLALDLVSSITVYMYVQRLPLFEGHTVTDHGI